MSNGIDLINIKKFTKILAKTNLLNKCFTQNELEYIKKTNNNISTIAGLFASKEAFLKSLNKGINNYDLKDIEILHNKDNSPYINISNKIKKDIDYKDISLSISHDGNYAIAIVTILF